MGLVESLKKIVGKVFGASEPQDNIAPGHVRIPFNTLVDMMGDIIPLNTPVPRLNTSMQSSAAELWTYMENVFDGTHCPNKDFQKKSSISAYLSLVAGQIMRSERPDSIEILECHIRTLIEKKTDMYLVARFAEQHGSAAGMPALPAKINNPTLSYIFEAKKAEPEMVSGRWNAQIIRKFAANIDMLQPFLTAEPMTGPKIETPPLQGAAPWGRSGRRPF